MHQHFDYDEKAEELEDVLRFGVIGKAQLPSHIVKLFDNGFVSCFLAENSLE